MRAPTLSVLKVANAESNSFAALARTIRGRNPPRRTMSWTLLSSFSRGTLGFTRTPIRVASGTNRRSKSNRFTSRDWVMLVTPVILSSGRLRLVTRPRATGSSPSENTKGILLASAIRASAAMTEILFLIRSAASSGSLSYFPSAER